MCINLSIFGMTVSNVPVTLALLPRKQYGLREKVLDSSAVRVQCTHRHWASAPLLCGCCGWRSRDAIGGRRCALHPWVFPEQHQANKSSKLRFLCSESGESSNLHFLLGRPDWRGAVMKVVLGNVACCWLVGLKRWDFRRKSEIWDLKESTKKDEL